MIVYHGTNIEDLIFLNPSYGRFGVGVYCTSDKKEAKKFGDKLIEVKVDPEVVTTIEYEDLIKFEPKLNIIEEEGLTNIRDFIDAEIIEVIYHDGVSEFIIYSKVSNIKYIN